MTELDPCRVTNCEGMQVTGPVEGAVTCERCNEYVMQVEAVEAANKEGA